MEILALRHQLAVYQNSKRPCYDFLGQWPTLKAAQLARCSPLERFFRQHHVHGEQRINERLEAIKSATALTSDEGIMMPQALLVKTLVTQLRVTLEAIGNFDQAIAEQAQRHPDFALFEALPGAGAAFAPRLLVAFGEQRERYGSAAELQKYGRYCPRDGMQWQAILGALGCERSHATD
jgi:hypothetical protein